MTLPKPLTSKQDGNGVPSAGSLRLEKMRQRKDFLATARGRRIHTKGFVLQIRERETSDAPRVGLTCSKKVGNAVARNRAKRRLREAARIALAPHARPGHDYVLIGRAEVTAGMPFDQMCRDLENALTGRT